jgi:hypothetical protein
MGDNPADIILQAVASLMQQDQKVFLAGPLATRLASVESDSRFQYDPVARNIATQISKVASGNPEALVTADQIDRFYKQIESLYPNTEFKTAFADLFPGVIPQPVALDTSSNPSRHGYTENDRKIGDSEISVVENQDDVEHHIPEFKIGATFKPELHRFAEKAITHELCQFGASNLRVAHKTNGPNLMVYVAQFVSPTGRHSVVVPIQVQNDTVILPEVFGREDRMYNFSKEGFAKFENDNLQIANVRATTAADQLRHAESVDAIRNPGALENYINEDTVEVAENDQIDPLAPALNNFSDIEATLSNAILRKQSKHNQRTISAASEVVARELKGLGQHETPVFAGDGKNGDILFAAQIVKNQKTASVLIPVETRGQTVLFPTVFAMAEQEYPLTQGGIEVAFEKNAPQMEFSVKTSNLAEANYNTLRQTVYASVMENDHTRAQEALQVVASKFGKEAIANVMKDYQDWIIKARTVSKNDIVKAGLGSKMTSDDWANSLQREINAVTNGKGIVLAKELDTIQFEKYDDPAFEGTIMTNRIDGIQLT